MFAKWNDAIGHFMFSLDDNGGIEISSEEHSKLLSAQASGKRIISDDNGYPVLADPKSPSGDELAEQVRQDRDSRLTSTNWLVERHKEQIDAGISTTLTADQYKNLLIYRQALRDVPAQAGFPTTINWPTSLI